MSSAAWPVWANTKSNKVHYVEDVLNPIRPWTTTLCGEQIRKDEGPPLESTVDCGLCLRHFTRKRLIDLRHTEGGDT